MGHQLLKVAATVTVLALAGCAGNSGPGADDAMSPAPPAGTQAGSTPSSPPPATSSAPSAPVSSFAPTRIGELFRAPLDGLVNGTEPPTDPNLIDWSEARASACDFVDPLLDGVRIQALLDNNSGRVTSLVIGYPSREIAKKAFSGLVRTFEGCSQSNLNASSVAAEPAWADFARNKQTLALVQYANTVVLIMVPRAFRTTAFAKQYQLRVDELG